MIDCNILALQEVLTQYWSTSPFLFSKVEPQTGHVLIGVKGIELLGLFSNITLFT